MALPFERLLTALNSRQFPVFSRPPAQLLNLALRFRVSRRLSISLAEYQKQLAEQQQLEEQKEQEQMLKKQQKQAAEGAGQQDGHAGQTGGDNIKTQEHIKAGQGDADQEYLAGKGSAAQPMENGHAGLAVMQPPGGSRSGELPDGPQQRGAPSTQQLDSASVGHQVSPFQGVQTIEPSQAQLLGDRGSEGRQEASGDLQEPRHHSTEASCANGRQRSPAGKGIGQRQEFSGEDDSFTSARSSPAAAAQGVSRGSPECFDPAASHENATGDQPSKQPSLLPRALSSGNPRQSSAAKGTPAGPKQSRDQGSKDPAKQGGGLLNFFSSASKGTESRPESTASQHLNGAAN